MILTPYSSLKLILKSECQAWNLFPRSFAVRVLREQREQKKRERMAKKKAKTTKSRDHLMSVRVIQRNLVYVIGLSPSLAKEEVLRRPDCFSIYGKIIKVVVNRQQFHGEGKPPSASAYITYEKPADARLAILSVDGFVYEGRTIRYETLFCVNMQLQ